MKKGGKKTEGIEERFAYTGIGGKQYAYWIFLESKVVHPQVFEYDTEPLPEIYIGRN